MFDTDCLSCSFLCLARERLAAGTNEKLQVSSLISAFVVKQSAVFFSLSLSCTHARWQLNLFALHSQGSGQGKPQDKFMYTLGVPISSEGKRVTWLPQCANTELPLWGFGFSRTCTPKSSLADEACANNGVSCVVSLSVSQRARELTMVSRALYVSLYLSVRGSLSPRTEHDDNQQPHMPSLRCSLLLQRSSQRARVAKPNVFIFVFPCAFFYILWQRIKTVLLPKHHST